MSARAVGVRPLQRSDADACDAIVLSLPYHFGHEGGRRECAAAVRTQSGLVAVVDGEVAGFLTVARHYAAAAEITWMAVRSDHRRRGVGGQLVARLCGQLRNEGRRLVLVLTVSTSDPGPDPDDGYGSTRRFYSANGFLEARDLPGYWDRDTPVVMVRPL